MTVALVTILGVALAGLLGIVQWQMNQFSRRLDRIEERLTALEIKVEHIATHLDDHLGPTFSPSPS